MTATPLPLDIDSPDIRRAGRDLLSVALMDARNHTLNLAAQLLDPLAAGGPTPWPQGQGPEWLLGHVGWFQERWIARHVLHQQGPAADGQAARLASIEPYADFWWGDSGPGDAPDPQAGRPDLGRVRAYLMNTLETTLELLERTPETDAALHFFRLALLHEDMQGERLIERAQAWGCPLAIEPPGPLAVREPLLVPAARWLQGLPAGPGLVLDKEQPAHVVEVPEFEIDAQPVRWSQFVEFVADGGYDRQELWHPDGWVWLQAQSSGQGGRAPRYVEQIGVASGAVLQSRFGSARRMLGAQPVLHVSWWEADAWCRWAGRRLPAEVEWELAACTAQRRGFQWGVVWEWTGTTARPYPGYVPGPWPGEAAHGFGRHKVLRGASFATRARMRHPRARNFQPPDADALFAGFRSCAQ